MRYEKLLHYIIFSLFIHAALFGAVLRMRSVYRDPLVLVEQGTSCIEIELQGFIESTEIQSSQKKPTDSEKKETFEQVPPSYKKDIGEKTVFKDNPEAEYPLKTHELPECKNETNVSDTYKDKRDLQKVDKELENKLSHDYENIKASNNTEEVNEQKEIRQPLNGLSGALGGVRTKGSLSAKIIGVGRPKYPKECLINGHEGRVVVEIIITSYGTNGGMLIAKSSGCKHMDESAFAFLKKCTLVPKMIMGVPVSSKKKIAFRFKITEVGDENTTDN